MTCAEDYNNVEFESPVENDEKINKDKEKKRGRCTSFTFRQQMTLTMLAAAEFMSFCSVSIMAPFYPKESADKGMSETMSGFVFAFHAAIVFISSPIFGKIIPKIGIKLSFTLGILLSGAGTGVFGTLQMVNDYTYFTVLSFVIRGLVALGASAYTTAAFVIIVNIFPDHTGAVRGVLETFVGLGMSAGPAIGGLLFAIGGFGLPFYVLGAIMVFLVPCNIYLLPVIKNNTVDNSSCSFLMILKQPQSLVNSIIVVVVAATWGFLDPTLEPHLRQFKLTPGEVALVFLLLSATYGLSCPWWGWLSDKIDGYYWLMIIGLLWSCLCLLFLGPTPIFTFVESTLWIHLVSLSLLGIVVAMIQMPTYRGLMDSALDGGFKETLTTHGIVAGLWSCMYSLGECIGPSVGGTLMERYGFPITSSVFAMVNLGVAILSTVYFTTRRRTTAPLENKTNPVGESYKNTDSNI